MLVEVDVAAYNRQPGSSRCLVTGACLPSRASGRKRLILPTDIHYLVKLRYI